MFGLVEHPSLQGVARQVGEPAPIAVFTESFQSASCVLDSLGVHALCRLMVDVVVDVLVYKRELVGNVESAASLV